MESYYSFQTFSIAQKVSLIYIFYITLLSTRIYLSLGNLDKLGLSTDSNLTIPLLVIFKTLFHDLYEFLGA